jgi:hypothetical protein
MQRSSSRAPLPAEPENVDSRAVRTTMPDQHGSYEMLSHISWLLGCVLIGVVSRRVIQGGPDDAPIRGRGPGEA